MNSDLNFSTQKPKFADCGKKKFIRIEVFNIRILLFKFLMKMFFNEVMTFKNYA